MFLSAIRRLPEQVAQQYAGKKRIALEEYRQEHPDGPLWFEPFGEHGFFANFTELSAALAEEYDSDPEVLKAEIPWVLVPCKPSSLKSPDAFELIHELCVDQEAPGGFEDRLDAASLQDALDNWFSVKRVSWWDTDRRNVVVLLPEERIELYRLATGVTLPKEPS